MQAIRIDGRVVLTPDQLADSTILLRFTHAIDAIDRDRAALGLEHTPEFVAQFRRKRQLSATTYGDLGEFAANIYTISESELSKRLFVFLNSERKGYFDPPSSKDLEVYLKKLLDTGKIIDKFPSCYQDIADARNCYALEQDTACVMHLMRVLEIGLGILAVEFNVSTARENWNTDRSRARRRRGLAAAFEPSAAS